jgi:hypothetical protein
VASNNIDTTLNEMDQNNDKQDQLVKTGWHSTYELLEQRTDWIVL